MLSAFSDLMLIMNTDYYNIDYNNSDILNTDEFNDDSFKTIIYIWCQKWLFNCWYYYIITF